LLNGQNQEMELFSGTKILLDLEVFSGIKGVCTKILQDLSLVGALVFWMLATNKNVF